MPPVYGGVKVPIERLVPFQVFPETPKFGYITFDDSSLGRFNKHCSKAAGVRDGGRLMNTLARRIESYTEIVNFVSRFKSRFWCARCENPFFAKPRSYPFHRVTI